MADKTEKAGKAGADDKRGADKAEKKPKKAPSEKADRKGGAGARGGSEEKAKVVSNTQAVTPRFIGKYTNDIFHRRHKETGLDIVQGGGFTLNWYRGRHSVTAVCRQGPLIFILAYHFSQRATT